MSKKSSRTGGGIREIISPLGSFGLKTSERGSHQFGFDCYSLRSSAGYSYIQKEKIKQGFELINKWKVIIGKATSESAASNKKDSTWKIITTLEILPPNSVCTFSYFIGGAFSSREEACNCAKYYATKFVRFLLLQCLSSINISREKFLFVPIQDFSESWSDERLYKKYDLTADEVALIEETIRPMEIGGDE